MTCALPAPVPSVPGSAPAASAAMCRLDVMRSWSDAIARNWSTCCAKSAVCAPSPSTSSTWRPTAEPRQRSLATDDFLIQISYFNFLYFATRIPDDVFFYPPPPPSPRPPGDERRNYVAQSTLTTSEFHRRRFILATEHLISNYRRCIFRSPVTQSAWRPTAELLHARRRQTCVSASMLVAMSWLATCEMTRSMADFASRVDPPTSFRRRVGCRDLHTPHRRTGHHQGAPRRVTIGVNSVKKKMNL